MWWTILRAAAEMRRWGLPTLISGKYSVSMVKTEKDRAVWLQRILEMDLLEFSTRAGYHTEWKQNRIE